MKTYKTEKEAIEAGEKGSRGWLVTAEKDYETNMYYPIFNGHFVLDSDGCMRDIRTS